MKDVLKIIEIFGIGSIIALFLYQFIKNAPEITSLIFGILLSSMILDPTGWLISFYKQIFPPTQKDLEKVKKTLEEVDKLLSKKPPIP